MPNASPVPHGSAEDQSARVSGCLDPVLALSLFNAWAMALRSANLSLKAVACRAASSILGEAMEDVRALACAKSAVQRWAGLLCFGLFGMCGAWPAPSAQRCRGGLFWDVACCAEVGCFGM